MRRAALVHVDRQGREHAASSYAAGAGVVEVDMGEQERARGLVDSSPASRVSTDDGGARVRRSTSPDLEGADHAVTAKVHNIDCTSLKVAGP